MNELATSWIGIISLILFILAYVVIALEDKLHIPKSKPALFIGTFLYLLIGLYLLTTQGYVPESLHTSAEHVILEIAGIFFFLYAAMVYIEALMERGVFESLKYRLISKGYSYKTLFWVTGALTFFISPIADNLTTALIFSTVLLTVVPDNHKVLIPGAINIVVASNAGGAWSPFGDITTLMVWNAAKAPFFDFFALFPASFLGWLLTAFLLSLSLPKGKPSQISSSPTQPKEGGFVVVCLGLLTIAISVISHQLFHLPAIIGMMFGLAMLMIYDISLTKRQKESLKIFDAISKIENDTLLFFFGLMAGVGALSYLGILTMASSVYITSDPTIVNIGVGFISAIIDNVPVMYAILKANPTLGLDQWLLVTLTAGIGGSLISFGSAAGVGVMGRMKGIYTFSSHFKLAWTVLAGYALSIIIWYIQFEILQWY